MPKEALTLRLGLHLRRFCLITDHVQQQGPTFPKQNPARGRKQLMPSRTYQHGPWRSRRIWHFALNTRLVRPRLTSRSGAKPASLQVSGEASQGKDTRLHRTTAGCIPAPLGHDRNLVSCRPRPLAGLWIRSLFIGQPFLIQANPAGVALPQLRFTDSTAARSRDALRLMGRAQTRHTKKGPHQGSHTTRIAYCFGVLRVSKHTHRRPNFRSV